VKGTDGQGATSRFEAASLAAAVAARVAARVAAGVAARVRPGCGQGGGRGGAYGRRMVGLQASRPGSTCKKEKSIEI
jgi:hypothetical protein